MPKYNRLFSKFRDEVYDTFHLGEEVTTKQMTKLNCFATYAPKTIQLYVNKMSKELVATSEGHFVKIDTGVFQVTK